MSFPTNQYWEEEEKYPSSYVDTQQTNIEIPDIRTQSNYHSKKSEIPVSQTTLMQQVMENKTKKVERSDSKCKITFTLSLMIATLACYLLIYFGDYPLIKVICTPSTVVQQQLMNNILLPVLSVFGGGVQAAQTQNNGSNIETFWFHGHVEIFGDFSDLPHNTVLQQALGTQQHMMASFSHGNHGHVINRRTADNFRAFKSKGRKLGGDRVRNVSVLLESPRIRQAVEGSAGDSATEPINVVPINEPLPLYQFVLNYGIIIPMILVAIAVVLTMCRYYCTKDKSRKFAQVALMFISFALF
eukprot:237768_1